MRFALVERGVEWVNGIEWLTALFAVFVLIMAATIVYLFIFRF